MSCFGPLGKPERVTLVAITIKQVLAGMAFFVVLSGALFWGVLTFTLGDFQENMRGMRDDVGAIRAGKMGD